MDSHAHARYERMPFFLWGYTALLLVAGLLLGPLSQLPAGLSKIILTETALITDYVLVAGPGPALVNAALVTAISILILHFARVPYNGITMVVIGLMSGFRCSEKISSTSGPSCSAHGCTPRAVTSPFPNTHPPV